MEKKSEKLENTLEMKIQIRDEGEWESQRKPEPKWEWTAEMQSSKNF